MTPLLITLANDTHDDDLPPLKLIVGLGNPGNQYANTRHNTGFWFVQQIADEFGIVMNLDKKFNGLIYRENLWARRAIIDAHYFYE